MTIKLQSPHRFPERFLLFGGAGSGKTNTVLNIASHLAEGTMHVLDADYSSPYDRALATEFEDAADRVDVHLADPEWEPFTEALAEIVTEGDPQTDWLVIDPLSPTWDAVQNWYLEQVYGHDLAAHIVKVRAEAEDMKEYNKQLTEDMNWSAVKKEYAKKVYGQIRKWKGNLILIAEGKAISDRDGEDVKRLYGPLGVKPSGESRTPHIAATNLFLEQGRRDVWKMTSVKDRNRVPMDKTEVDDFGLDYLVGIAGWERA